MSGSLSSLNSALTALRFNRVALDVASHNIANATTEGYTRRRVVGEALGTSPVPALWSRDVSAAGSVGSGVGVGSIDRLNDALLDARGRSEHASQAYLDVRSAVLQRVEAGIGEPGDTGVAAAMSDFRAAWHDLANDPGSDAARGQVIARGQALADAVHVQAAHLDTESADQRSRLLGVVAETNTVAKELAATNRAVATAALDGTDTSALLDQRDQLALRLSELVGGSVTARADGGFDVTVGGVALVTGAHAGTLVVTGGVAPDGSPDGAPVSFGVTDSSATTAVPAGTKGALGAVTDLLTTTLPAYSDALAAVVETLADEVNAVHAASYDRAGGTGQAFFAFTPGDAARSLQVALTSGDQVAVSALPGGALDGSAAATLGATGAAEGAYQRLVAGFGTEVASVKRLATTQRLMTTQVDAAREQLSGVNLDEEMVNMLSAQRSYEAASRVMTVVDSVLDTLINRTGLLR